MKILGGLGVLSAVGPSAQLMMQLTASTAASSGSEDADGEELVEPPEPEATEPPSTEPASTDCVICWDGDAEYAAVPCGHRCLCANCSQTVSECPVCRAAMTAVLRVFV